MATTLVPYNKDFKRSFCLQKQYNNVAHFGNAHLLAMWHILEMRHIY